LNSKLRSNIKQIPPILWISINLPNTKQESCQFLLVIVKIA